MRRTGKVEEVAGAAAFSPMTRRTTSNFDGGATATSGFKHQRGSALVEFNLADMFECVVDAVPDREARRHEPRTGWMGCPPTICSGVCAVKRYCAQRQQRTLSVHGRTLRRSRRRIRHDTAGTASAATARRRTFAHAVESVLSDGGREPLPPHIVRLLRRPGSGPSGRPTQGHERARLDVDPRACGARVGQACNGQLTHLGVEADSGFLGGLGDGGVGVG